MMQQLLPLSNMSSSPSAANGAGKAASTQLLSGRQSEGEGAGRPVFGALFKGLNELSVDEGMVPEAGAKGFAPMSWENFASQFPELAEKINSELDAETLLVGLESLGINLRQDLASLEGQEGELLPLNESPLPENLAATDVIGSLDAWLKQEGYQIKMSPSGSLSLSELTLDSNPLDDLSGADFTLQGLELDTKSLERELSGLFAQAMGLTDPSQTSNSAAFGQSVAGFARENGGLNLGLSRQLNSPPPNPVNALTNPVSGVVDANDGVQVMAPPVAQSDKTGSQGAVSNTAAMPAQGLHASTPADQGMQQGQFGGGRSEGDEQLQKFQDLFAAEGGSDLGGDEGAQLRTSESPALKFSSLQSRLPDPALKQYTTSLNTPVEGEQWGDEIGQKIVWLTGRNIQSAEIHLNPAELGPVDVKINIQNDQATVTFNVHSATVRDLLELNVHRLRDMMNENGVQLADVDVGSGTEQQFAQEQSQFGDGGGSNSNGDEKRVQNAGQMSGVVQETVSVLDGGSGLVDYYA